MQLEIHKPEIEQRIHRHIQSGRFQDVAELLTEALDAIEKRLAPNSDDSGAALLEVLQNSPYPEIDLAPPRGRSCQDVLK